MKKTITICAILFAFCLIFTSCGNKCEHTYDNACDAVCNECGELREVGAHDFAVADCDTPKTCKTCGTTEGEALGHNPKADDGNCTTPVTCTACDKVMVEAKIHDCTGEWQKNETAHWHACRNEGCNVTDEKIDHTPNQENATTTAPKRCVDCDYIIEKQIPVYEVPTEITAIYGQTLAEIALPEGFAWQDATAFVGNIGEIAFKVTYTPADTDIYAIVTDIDITITATKSPKVERFDGEWVVTDESQAQSTSQSNNGTTIADMSLPIHLNQNETDTEMPALELVGQQLDLNNGISMKFHVKVNDTTHSQENIKLVVNFLGTQTILDKSVLHPTDNSVYIFTLVGITPQCMGDPMDVTICIGDELVEHENATLSDYSVEKNLLEIRKASDEVMVQLIDDLLAYGKAACDYTKHYSITENYVGSGREVSKSTTSATGTSVVTQYKVRFDSINSIIIEIKGAINAVYLDGAEIRNNGGGPSNYMIRNISATDFDKEYTFDFHYRGSPTGTFSISVNDYLYAISQSETASQEMKALAKALYNYGVSAKEYAISLNN